MKNSVKLFFTLFFLLVVFGMVMVFNVKVFTTDVPEQKVWSIISGQVFNFSFAAILFMVAYLVNLEIAEKWIKIIMLFTLLLLTATLIIGVEINGAKRWIDLYFMRIQPSEFAKITAVIYLSEVICNKRDRIGLFKELIYPFALISIMVLLISIEDLGTGVLILGVSVFMLLMGGMRFKYFGILALMAAGVIVILIAMRPYRINRLKTFLDPWEYKQDSGYQQVQSEVALGRGGLTGVGFGNSQRKKKYLPEAATDFIFAVIGEEFGFIGSVSLILMFMLFFYLGSSFAFSVESPFAFYIISGSIMILTMQALFNIGVALSVIPNKGLPLPFISYGGSSLLSSSILVGLIMNAAVTGSRHYEY